MTEFWLPVRGYEGLYAVSDLGRVRSFHGRGRVLKPGTSRGYLYVALWKCNEGRRVSIHRLVLSAFIGSDDRQVNHRDGDPSNNRLSNLEYCTQVENIRHRSEVLGIRKGWAGVTGPANPCSRDYLVTFPDGTVESVTGLNDFCRRNGLSQGAMAMVASGRSRQHRGFRCTRINLAG